MNKKNGTTKLVRSKFGPGMLLQHEDLELLNSYTQNLSRLLFRSFFGCGVICGLVVQKPEFKCGKLFITVESGVALTCAGDPVWVPEKVEFAPSDNAETDLGDPLWVVLCRTVKCCGPRTSVCESDDEEGTAVCTREIEGYEIRVETSRKCYCGSPVQTPQPETDTPYYSDHYKGKCGCSCGECSDCDCNCILLARLDNEKDPAGIVHWSVDHRVRSFVRPVLMRDPQVEIEDSNRKKPGPATPPPLVSDPAAPPPLVPDPAAPPLPPEPVLAPPQQEQPQQEAEKAAGQQEQTAPYSSPAKKRASTSKKSSKA